MNDEGNIIRWADVLDRTSLSRNTIYRKMAEGTFPKQRPGRKNGAGWIEAAVAEWIADPEGYRADAAV